jgi:hypothetical protein
MPNPKVTGAFARAPPGYTAMPLHSAGCTMIGTCNCAFAIAGSARNASRHPKNIENFFMDKINLRMRGMPCAIEKATTA